MKHVCTAVAYLQGALHELDKERAAGGDTRELATAYTGLETALMWLERDKEFKHDADARQAYMSKRQPYLPPELMDVNDLAKLTAEERVGMFGYDPLEDDQ